MCTGRRLPRLKRQGRPRPWSFRGNRVFSSPDVSAAPIGCGPEVGSDKTVWSADDVLRTGESPARKNVDWQLMKMTEIFRYGASYGEERNSQDNRYRRQARATQSGGACGNKPGRWRSAGWRIAGSRGNRHCHPFHSSRADRRTRKTDLGTTRPSGRGR